MSNFITFSEMNKRLSDAHKEMRDKAVEEINKYIREAKEMPVRFPKALLTDVECVQRELIRKLREEAGWDYFLCVASDPAPSFLAYTDFKVADTVVLISKVR